MNNETLQAKAAQVREALVRHVDELLLQALIKHSGETEIDPAKFVGRCEQVCQQGRVQFFLDGVPILELMPVESHMEEGDGCILTFTQKHRIL